eukprot:SAG11_NODE_26556_length_339_cov_3.479508_1_plen_55_part_10
MTLVPPMVALAVAQGTCPEIAQAVSWRGDALRQPSRTLKWGSMLRARAQNSALLR